MDSQAFFESRPVFTLAQAQRALAPEAPGIVRDRLKYHAKTGRLLSIVRGVYATVPFGVAPDKFQPDPLLIAAAVRDDAVLGYYTALSLLGAARSTWSVISAFSRRRRASIVLSNARIVFFQTPSAVARLQRQGIGLRTIDRQGQSLLITGPERTLVDGLREPGRVGGTREFIESAAGLSVLDLDLVERLLRAYDEKVLWAAVGWFLETHQREFSVDDTLLRRLEKSRPRSRVYLARDEGPGWVATRWNLILPETLRRNEPNAG